MSEPNKENEIDVPKIVNLGKAVDKDNPYQTFVYEGTDFVNFVTGNGSQNEPLKGGAGYPWKWTLRMVYDLARQRDQEQFGEVNSCKYKIDPDGNLKFGDSDPGGFKDRIEKTFSDVKTANLSDVFREQNI